MWESRPVRTVSLQSGDGPHPRPPVYRLVPFRFLLTPWPCFALWCALRPFLSFPAVSSPKRKRKRESKAAQHRDGNGNETLPCKGRKRNARQRTNGTERNGTGTYQRNTGTDGNPKRKEARKGRGRPTFLPLFPFPLSFLFPSFPVPVRAKEKLFFRLYAIVRPLFTKLGKINL